MDILQIMYMYLNIHSNHIADIIISLKIVLLIQKCEIKMSKEAKRGTQNACYVNLMTEISQVRMGKTIK